MMGWETTERRIKTKMSVKAKSETDMTPLEIKTFFRLFLGRKELYLRDYYRLLRS